MSSRNVVIAGNWKMNHTVAETRAFFSALASTSLSPLAVSALKSGKLRTALFPSFLSLAAANESAAALPFALSIGAQHLNAKASGAFTGEVSGPMAKETGVTYALVGHSERRQYYGETNTTAKERAQSLLEQGFTVIFCVGETRTERENGQTQQVLERQLGEGLPPAAAAETLTGRFLIAYEPVWAIGTGLTASPEQAQEAHVLIRKFLAQAWGGLAALACPLLYGGSVTAENARALLAGPDVDGALVGGASLKPASWAALIEAGAQRVNLSP